ncbi:MAG: NERD domain-containing protein [Bacilli bacterium]|nr:NERD domain-containing protein [Bacilli bacterium]
MSKISRGDKGESLVIKVLERIKDYHHILNDVTFENAKSGMTHQLDHILIHPHGVFVIETKNYAGKITINPISGYWIKEIRGTKSKINNPLLQNKSHAINLYKILKGKYEIIPVVVFAQNNAPYLPDDNVINLNDLLLFIESYPFKQLLDNKNIDKIKELIEKETITISRKDHVTNIHLYQEFRKEQQSEMTYAIENRKCPKCQSEMIYKYGILKCTKCSYKFKV